MGASRAAAIGFCNNRRQGDACRDDGQGKGHGKDQTLGPELAQGLG